MNPYNNNPFRTDTSRDTRSEYVANKQLHDYLSIPGKYIKYAGRHTYVAAEYWTKKR